MSKATIVDDTTSPSMPKEYFCAFFVVELFLLVVRMTEASLPKIVQQSFQRKHSPLHVFSYSSPPELMHAVCEDGQQRHQCVMVKM